MMIQTRLSRLGGALAVAAVLLVGCSSDPDSATADSSTTTTATADATAAEATEGETRAVETTAVETTTTAAATTSEPDPDDGSENDNGDDSEDDPLEDDPLEDDASGEETELAELEAALAFFGVAKPAEAAACISDEAGSEGVPLGDVVGGPGLLIGLYRCAPESIRESFGEDFAAAETSSISATPAQINCVLDSFISTVAAQPFADAEALFSSDDPPQEIVDAVADTCGISESDADFIFNEI